MYVYIYTRDGYGDGLYTVGFYTPDGKWMPESDHKKKGDAARRVAWLNGYNPGLDEALNSGDGVYRP